jgi:hypothetical protein
MYLAEGEHTRERLCFLCRHRAKMFKIGLVADKHDYDVAVRVITELLQPAGDIRIGRMLGDIVHEQSTNGTAVVGGCDGTVALLTS